MSQVFPKQVVSKRGVVEGPLPFWVPGMIPKNMEEDNVRTAELRQLGKKSVWVEITVTMIDGYEYFVSIDKGFDREKEGFEIGYADLLWKPAKGGDEFETIIL